MTSKTGVLITFVFCVVHTSGLVELPKVDDNSILTTEAAIRNTINTLFVTLQLKDVRKKPRLKEYSIVHNHLVSVTLQDYKNLKEIAKLTRVDKKNTNNETESFMCALNDLLNEDIEVDHKDHISDTNDVKNDDVIKYIKQFLAHLESLKEEYGVNRESQRIKEDIYQTLNKYGNISFNYTKITKLDKSDENDAVLDTNYYWKPELSGRRIFQGERVKIKYFPFMANVQIFNRFQCGGAILMSDLVVTASSCVQLAYNNRFFRENPAFLSVKVGSHFYDSGESVAVLEVYFHPEYNPKNLHNNICLMRLVRKVNLKKRRVKKINFDRNGSPLPVNTDGITIIGWGAKGTSNIIQDELHNQLSFAVLDMYPLQECQEIYSKEYVTRKNFCAGFFSKGGGACNRDVGGPGIVNGLLMGVVSFGSPICGTPDAPTVFTKIGYYTDWIEDIMEQHVPSSRQRTTLAVTRVITPPPVHITPELTTFKIPPLSGKPKPIPINEVEALRMIGNSQLFSEFLATMFGSKENEEYQDLLHYARGSHLERQDSAQTASPTTSKRIHSQTKSVTPPLIELRTPIGDVEPEAERDRSVEEEEDDAEERGELEEEEEEEEGEFEEEFEVEDFKYPMHATKMISYAEPASPPAGSLKSSKHTDLERDLVNLLDNIDLKQIINNMSSLEEDKLLDESKVLKLLKDKKVNSKMLDDDESILTLLYLSDSEKKQVSNKHVNVVKDDSTAEIEGGLSIETGPFQDMTYRVGNNFSMLNDLLEQEELYDLLRDTIKN